MFDKLENRIVLTTTPIFPAATAEILQSMADQAIESNLLDEMIRQDIEYKLRLQIDQNLDLDTFFLPENFPAITPMPAVPEQTWLESLDEVLKMFVPDDVIKGSVDGETPLFNLTP